MYQNKVMILLKKKIQIDVLKKVNRICHNVIIIPFLLYMVYLELGGFIM